MKTVFLRVLDAGDKATALLTAIREPEVARGRHRFDVGLGSFVSIPRSPFAYWVSDQLRDLFKELPPFEAEGRTAKQGLATADDFRFVRGWWALPPRRMGKQWFPFAKGGKFSPFYADVYMQVLWELDGNEMKAWASSLYNNSHWSRILKNIDFFFRCGLTWPLRGIRFSAQAIPAGCVFSVAGKMAFVDQQDFLWFLGLFNSLAFDKFIAFFAGNIRGVQYEVGLIQLVPVPTIDNIVRTGLSTLAHRAWSLNRDIDTRIEISHAFTLPALLQLKGGTLTIRTTALADHARAIEAELAAIQAEIDERCFDLYGIDETDSRTITEGFGASTTVDGSDDDAAPDIEGDTGDESEAGSITDSMGLAAELVSWTIGVAFGRFDIRLATGARSLPPEPEPFDPLPVCSPGMLTGDDGLPLAHSPSDYPITFPESGILVDDPGHAQDITAAVHSVFDVVFGADADLWWKDTAALLDPKNHDLRTWLASNFFEYHLKRYSKSRRRAPILWQLGTPSGRYSVWLYAHRMTHDTFFQLQNDVVGPKLLHEERQLASLVQSAGGSPSARERKEIAAQEIFIEELRTLLDEVKRVAPLWNPNLDDGIVLVMAPLWRLVPQHKAWQKELRSRWGELVAGKYDWAHLAMHLWPERVVPKCATDRSLAIAHGLEAVFWVEDDDGKWTRRVEPTRPIDELIRERTSPAVKESLKSLLEAPVPGGTSQRKRKGDRS